MILQICFSLCPGDWWFLCEPGQVREETEPQPTLSGQSWGVKETEMWGLFVTESILTDVISDVPSISRSTLVIGFSGGSDSKESACNVGDPGSIPGLGKFPGEGNGYPSSILAWRIPWTEDTNILLEWFFQWSCMDVRIGL